jgi:EmrB/QacA subfamily drug resistance transporter
MLIAARGLMGIGAAFIFPTTLSILTNTFTGHERARAIGVWAGVSGIGVALGPLLGGILVEHFYWGSVFLVNVPICVLALVLGYFFIPTSRDPDNRPLDPLGAFLSILTLVALLYAIIQAPEEGWLAPDVLASFGAAILLLGVFAWWEMHSPQPMIDVRVFRNPRFSAASSVLTLTSFALYGSIFLLIQYFQFVLGYSPLEAGLLAMPVAVAMMVVSPNAPRLVRRWGTKRVVVAGLLVVAVAMLCYGSNLIMSSFVGGCAVRALFGIGLGLTSAPATESIMGSLPPSRAGVGSAINDTTRQTGGALGVAIIGSVFLASYHHFADKAQHLSAASSAAVHDSVGRAIELAQKLPAAQGAEIVRLSRQAFIDAMRLTYPIAAAFIFFAAFIAWRWLPAHGHDEFASVEAEEEAREISEFEVLGT